MRVFVISGMKNNTSTGINSRKGLFEGNLKWSVLGVYGSRELAEEELEWFRCEGYMAYIDERPVIENRSHK